ncbi:MAG: sulfotransferase [Woeseiaceae bacterium]|nr:sulfotransferase [Woeseiaceae bacterium]
MLLLKTPLRLAILLWQAVIPRPFPGIGAWLRRILVMALFLPLLVLLQLLHWVGFLLDELLFPGYRKVDIREPVFVLGVPRSGTTFLHRMLARDPAFTTFSTWECVFAPSIAERFFWRGIGRLDRLVGEPLGRLMRLAERRVLAAINGVHPVSLGAPEEDYFVFMPLLCCFILVVPFPGADWLWRMARFDRDLSERERVVLLNWYRRCLQKHLYANGQDSTLLSKNASFAGMVNSLVDTFPDCRLVVCERDALHAIASQFNSLAPGLKAFGGSARAPEFRDRLLDSLHFYYENLAGIGARIATARASLWALSRDTRSVLTAIYAYLERPVPAAVEAGLRQYESRSEPGSPVSSPSLSAWGLDTAELGNRFARWRHEDNVRL